MKITLEFTDAERFMKELPQFAKVIGFASQFVQFSRTGKKDGDVDIQANVPDVMIGPDGEHLVEAGEAKRVIEAAKKVGAWVENAPEKAPEKPQDAPKETADKVSTDTAKAPENAKSEASADKEKPSEIMPKPADPPKGTPDIAAVRKVLHKAIEAGHRDEMKALLDKLGAQSVSTLDPSKFTEFITEANKIGGGDNA